MWSTRTVAADGDAPKFRIHYLFVENEIIRVYCRVAVTKRYLLIYIFIHTTIRITHKPPQQNNIILSLEFQYDPAWSEMYIVHTLASIFSPSP